MTSPQRLELSTSHVFSVNQIRYTIGDPVRVSHFSGRIIENQTESGEFSLVTVISPATGTKPSGPSDGTRGIEQHVDLKEWVVIESLESSVDTKGDLGANWIEYIIKQYEQDDVFQRPFLTPFKELNLLGDDPSFRAVAVPSRIHRPPTKDKPLNGMRFAVKDIYHLKGIRTSFGSRSYYNVHGPESQTAEAVTKLQDLGAVVLGKLKLTQFGAWEEPAEAVDYPAPFNPRADEFQSPAGSSSGPACALAAYDWIDITLGSDTTGSILRPGLWGGLFALRPTWHAVSYEGMGQGVEALDMAGCYARRIEGLRDFSSLWLDYEKLEATPKSFTSIIWVLDMWDPVDADQQKLAREFLTDLETHLNIKPTNVSFEKTWNEDLPSEAYRLSLGAYINDACDEIFFEMFQRFQNFIAKHEKKFGFPPYLSPANVADWELFKTITEDQWKESLKRMDVYRLWFCDMIVAGDKSHALFILPIEYLAPRYRDDEPNFRRPPPGVIPIMLSPAMKAPELVIPIGEIPYESKITKQEEQLPFAVGVMGPPGTDLHMMDAVKDVLKKSDRPQSVHIGKSMFKKQVKPSWLCGNNIEGRD